MNRNETMHESIMSVFSKNILVLSLIYQFEITALLCAFFVHAMLLVIYLTICVSILTSVRCLFSLLKFTGIEIILR